MLSQNSLSAFALSVGLLGFLGILLSLGRRLQPAIRLERLGIPIALILGSIGLLIGPYGYFPLLSESITDIWVKLPSPLLTLVFASLMIGRPIPKGAGFIKPVASQALLGLLLGFGQYLVGGLVVLYVLIPYLDVNPLMGCLIEVGFEGGHGAAAIMGDSFSNLGFPEGLDLGLAMATLGLLCSTLLGSGLVVIGRMRGWVVPQKIVNDINSEGNTEQTDIFAQISRLFINLLFVGIAVLIGLLMLYILRYFSQFLSDFPRLVLEGFPVFPLALLGSLIVRFILEIASKTEFVSQLLQREISTLATDLLITTAMASLNLPLLLNDWLPLTTLALTGLIWNLTGVLVFARVIFNEEWFERSITEFGNATGVAASGLLLLRLADPRNSTQALPIFSIKQLLLQPLLSGGIITVLAPIAIVNVGLLGWTEICGVLTVMFIIIALVIKVFPKEDVP